MGAVQRLPRNRDRQASEPDVLRVHGEVGVHVDQAGQDGGVGEIDQPVIGRTLGLANGPTFEFVTLDHNGLVGEHLAGAHIQQFSGVDNDLAGGLGAGPCATARAPRRKDVKMRAK